MLAVSDNQALPHARRLITKPKKTAGSHWQDILDALMSNLQTGQRITTDHLQGLFHLKLTAAAEFIDTLLDHLQAAARIRDCDTLVEFVSNQIRVGEKIKAFLLSDANELTELTLSYPDSLARRTRITAPRARPCSRCWRRTSSRVTS